ncbi:MAG: hypothetical protein ACTSW1_14410 [Candidatus Hodarchaeales archaeon]
MLLTPKKKIITLRLLVAFVICTTFLSFFLLTRPTEIMNFLDEDNTRNEQYKDAPQGFDLKENLSTPIISHVNILVIVISSLVTFCLLFLYTPSFTRFLPKSTDYRMKWKLSKFLLPERVLVVETKDSSVIIRRNRLSLGGLFLNNYIMEVHIKKEKIDDIRGLMDYIGITKFEERESKYVGYKTVSISNLPLQIIQFKAILDIYT